MKKVLILVVIIVAYCYIDWYAKPPRERIGIYGPAESYMPAADLPDTFSAPVDTIIAVPKISRNNS